MNLLGRIRSDYVRILKNFFSLSVINGVSYLLALLTVPYLTRYALGVEKYGSYIFMYAIAQYLLLVGNYGFKFSVTRQISVYREDRVKINQIFNATIGARLLLSTVAVVVGMVPVALLMTENDLLMYLFALGIVYGDVFIPTWLFQGMEEMKFLTMVNVLSKCIFALLIFVFIKTPEDYIYVILLNSLGCLAAGAWSARIALKRFGLTFSWPAFAQVKEQLRQGWHLFVSNIGMELYRNSNVFLLGLFVNDTAVGLFGAVEKIVKALQTILNAFPMALFPYVSKKFFGASQMDNIFLLRRMMKWFSLFLSLIMLAFILSSPLISTLIYGFRDAKTEWIIALVSPVLLFGCMNYIVGIVGLVNMGYAVAFQKNIWIAGISSVLLMLLFVHPYSYYAAAAAWSWAEMLLFFSCLVSIHSIKHRKGQVTS